MIEIERYRGERIFCQSVPSPGGGANDNIFRTLDGPGIWFTLKALRDYIDFTHTSKQDSLRFKNDIRTKHNEYH